MPLLGLRTGHSLEGEQALQANEVTQGVGILREPPLGIISFLWHRFLCLYQTREKERGRRWGKEDILGWNKYSLLHHQFPTLLKYFIRKQILWGARSQGSHGMELYIRHKPYLWHSGGILNSQDSTAESLSCWSFVFKSWHWRNSPCLVGIFLLPCY